ncbi:hypothetical protein K2X33_09760 [bacterium]|nr:hypothetical protein [bacterium]
MKRTLFVFAILLAACGREVQRMPTCGYGARCASAEAVPDCPLKFSKAGLCGSLTWLSPLKAEAPIQFSLKVTKQSDGSPAAAPAIQGVFVMKCCGTPTAITFQDKGGGSYEAQSTLSAGKYSLFLRVDSSGEKQSVDLSVQ